MIRTRLVALAAVALLSTAASGGPVNTNWATLGNSTDQHHHSDLTQIDTRTVATLDLAWWSPLPAPNGLVGNPLVKNGVIFQGGPFGQIFAHDLRTGKALWTFSPPSDVAGTSYANYIAYNMNRGAALAGDNVIIAYHCDLIAVNQKTGKQAWRSKSCNVDEMFGITAAPRVGDGMVFTGNGCMDAGTDRGFVDAFDVATGKRKWRFYTMPGDPAKETDPFYRKVAKSWGTDWYSKTHGCASVWDAMVYDTRLHQLVFGTGDASPWTPVDRAPDAGDELFTNAVVAVDGRTGKYRWHFTVTKHDGWGFEAATGLMLADLPIAEKQRRVVLSVPKNGYAFTLDAATGKFLAGGSYTRINWSSGLDKQGNAIQLDTAKYWSRTGDTIVLPSGMGAHGWEPMAFNAKNRTLFIPVMSMPMNYKRDTEKQTIGGGLTSDYYYGSEGDPNYVAHGELVAWDPIAAKVKWRVNSTSVINSGLLETAGGLVFQGQADGNLVAYDERTGKELWRRQTGGAIRGAPSTVMVDGQQYLIVATGNGAAAATGYVSRYTTTPEARTPTRLLAFRLGGRAAYPALANVQPLLRPAVARADAGLAKAGARQYEALGCYACHGLDGVAPGGRAPSFTRVLPPTFDAFRKIVDGGMLAKTGMPRFEGLSEDDLRSLYAYVTNAAWDAYDKQGEKH